jgi:hypothetical protein
MTYKPPDYYDALGMDCTPAQFAIATRVAQEFYGAVEDPRTPRENLVGSGLPGDTHGRLGLDPEPFRGANLSRNPHPRISPQTMPVTLQRPYIQPTGNSSLYESDGNPRHVSMHVDALRKLAER